MRQSICTAEKLGKRILLEMEKLLRSNDLGRSDWHPGSLETDCDDWCILADDLLGNADKLVDAVEGLLMLCGKRVWFMNTVEFGSVEIEVSAVDHVASG